MTEINYMNSIYAHAVRLADMWPGKLAIGTVVSGICATLGIDVVIFGILTAGLTGEMVTRILVGCKRGKSLCRELQHGIARYTFYGLFLLMAVGVDIAVRRSMGFAIPIVDLFMVYLFLTDCTAIIGNAVKLHWPVPPILRQLVYGSRRRVEKTLEHIAGEKPEKDGDGENKKP